MKPISKGYIYSMVGGLFRYEGVIHYGPTPNNPSGLAHFFTIVKRVNAAKNHYHEQYQLGPITDWTETGGVLGVRFTRHVFKLLAYEQTLTVLHGNKI